MSRARHWSGVQALPCVPLHPVLQHRAARLLPGQKGWTINKGFLVAGTIPSPAFHSWGCIQDISSLQHETRRWYRALFWWVGSTRLGSGTCSILAEPFLCLVKLLDPTGFLGSFCLVRMRDTDNQISAVLPL